jgi:hypothetical protein
VDESWIGSQQENKVMLIPRMKGWVATYYPGTRIGITEYNWGAQSHINGATTQADILGIYGREGLDLATRWTTPSNTTPTYKAMKMFRNYDGNKSCFGDTSVNAAGPNAVANATTNSPEFKGTLPTTSYTPTALASSGRFFWRVDEMAGACATTGAVWTFATSVNLNASLSLSSALGSGDNFVVTLPSLPGQTYRVEKTDSLRPTSWSAITDNVPGTGYSIPIPDTGVPLRTQCFYRALILPP